MIRPLLTLLWLAVAPVASLRTGAHCGACVAGEASPLPRLASAGRVLPEIRTAVVVQDDQNTDDDDDYTVDPPLLVAIFQLGAGVILCLWGIFHLNHRRRVFGSVLLVTGGVVCSSWPLVFWLW